jgi:hypothetical protein
MRPGIKIDINKIVKKGLDTAKECYHKYGKDYPIKDYVNEYRAGTNAKEIIKNAGGLKQLPHAMEQIKDAQISIDMNEDVFTINRKLKLGQMAQRKINAENARIAAEKAAIEKAIKEQPETKTEE